MALLSSEAAHHLEEEKRLIVASLPTRSAIRKPFKCLGDRLLWNERDACSPASRASLPSPSLLVAHSTIWRVAVASCTSAAMAAGVMSLSASLASPRLSPRTDDLPTVSPHSFLHLHPGTVREESQRSEDALLGPLFHLSDPREEHRRSSQVRDWRHIKIPS